MNKIPVIIIGAGNIANNAHIPVWRNIKETEIFALCDKNADNLNKTAKRWDIQRLYSDFDEIQCQEKAIVDICTNPDSHCDLAIKAFRAGYHVVIEKPMALSLGETDRILSEYTSRKSEGLKLCILHTFLFAPQIIELRKSLRERSIEILAVDINMLHTSSDAWISDRNHWVHSMPGGRVGESLVHPIYLLRNLIGPLHLRDLYSAKRGDYEWVDRDELHATFESDGKFGSIYMSYNSPRWTYSASIKVYGKERQLLLDGTNLSCVAHGPLLQGYLPGVPVSMMAVVRDSFDVAGQTLTSTAKNVLTTRLRSGHKTLLRGLVDSIAKGTETMYPADEACEANKMYIEILSRLK